MTLAAMTGGPANQLRKSTRFGGRFLASQADHVEHGPDPVVVEQLLGRLVAACEKLVADILPVFAFARRRKRNRCFKDFQLFSTHDPAPVALKTSQRSAGQSPSMTVKTNGAARL